MDSSLGRHGEGEWESSMYGPPSITRGRGLPLFSARAWDQIRALRPDFPGIDALRTPDSRETARLCQWIAPARALGTFPAEPRLRRELLMVVMEGDLEAEADAVDRCLHEHFNGRCRMETLPMQSTGVLVEFWLDLPGRAGFPVAARMQDRMCLLLDGDIALVESSA
jgi:hypothetical protein